MKSTFLRDTIIFLCIAGIIMYIGIDTIYKQYNQINEECNNQYGKDKWKLLEITGTARAERILGKYHIGKVWTCISNATQLKDNQLLVRL